MRSTIFCICIGVLAVAILAQLWWVIPFAGFGVGVCWGVSDARAAEPPAEWHSWLPEGWDNEPRHVRNRMEAARRLYVNGSIHWTEFLQRVDAADEPDAIHTHFDVRPMTDREKRAHLIEKHRRPMTFGGPTIAEQRYDIARYKRS